MKTVIQIIPFRRQVPDGVGDYGSQIATAWKEFDGTQTIFLATAPNDNEGECQDGHETHYLKARTSKALVEILDQIGGPSAKIILHMSAYGHQKRAIPFWLLSGLRMYKAQHTNSLIVSIFHEICAVSKKPWQSSFWLMNFQKYIARQVSLLSDSIMTPCEKYLAELKDMDRTIGKPALAMPVFSTVGEPKAKQNKTALSQKGLRLVIFGGRQSRVNIFTQKSDLLAKLCCDLGVREIVDIGAIDSRIPTSFNGLIVHSTGILSAEDVSEHLSHSHFAVLSYDSSRMGKSTIFAAYAAHRLSVVCFDDSQSASDGLINGRDLLVTDRALTSSQIDSLKSCGGHAQRWYEGHALHEQIPTFAAQLTRC